MASRVTPPPEEEGPKVEGMVEVGGSVISAHVHFGRIWALLRRTEVALMAPMIV